jgi:hypothetical protein
MKRILTLKLSEKRYFNGFWEYNILVTVTSREKFNIKIIIWKKVILIYDIGFQEYAA